MHELIKQLYDLLEIERSRYEQLAELMRREEEALLHVRAAELPDVQNAREDLEHELHELERRRSRLAGQLAGALGCEPEELRLQALLPHVPEQGRALLEELRAGLDAAVELVRRRSERLRLAAGSLMNIYREMLAGIARGAGASSPVSYAGAVGRQHGRAASGSVMLSRQV